MSATPASSHEPSTGPEPDRALLRRVTLSCQWGEGLDGFDLGVISVTLPAITLALGLSPVMAGLVGASSLIGIFVGAPLAGRLTDLFGRKRLFLADLLALIVLGVLQCFVAEGWQLLLVRLLLGAAIGAEYTVGAAVLAEFTGAEGRGRRLSGLLVCWYVGYLAAVVVAYGLTDLFDVSWRWVLATGTLPAVVTLLARIGVPESPRWLLHRGRDAEAHAIVDRFLGGDAFFRSEEFAGEADDRGGYRDLFTGEHRRKLIFVGVFWACQVAPYFAIFTFAPTVFASLHLADGTAGTLAANGVAAVGALVGMLTIERVGRRTQLIPPFWLQAGALGIVGIWADAPGAVVVLCFGVFSFFNALSSNLTAVYPIEIFPTSLRSSAVGVSAAFSRVGAAIGTFLLPVGIDTIGIGPCMLVGAGICLLGGVVSLRMAPETTGRSLTASSRGADVREKVVAAG